MKKSTEHVKKKPTDEPQDRSQRSAKHARPPTNTKDRESGVRPTTTASHPQTSAASKGIVTVSCLFSRPIHASSCPPPTALAKKWVLATECQSSWRLHQACPSAAATNGSVATPFFPFLLFFQNSSCMATSQNPPNLKPGILKMPRHNRAEYMVL